jgi:hypothetical protein
MTPPGHVASGGASIVRRRAGWPNIRIKVANGVIYIDPAGYRPWFAAR